MAVVSRLYIYSPGATNCIFPDTHPKTNAYIHAGHTSLAYFWSSRCPSCNEIMQVGKVKGTVHDAKDKNQDADTGDCDACVAECFAHDAVDPW